MCAKIVCGRGICELRRRKLDKEFLADTFRFAAHTNIQQLLFYCVLVTSKRCLVSCYLSDKINSMYFWMYQIIRLSLLGLPRNGPASAEKYRAQHKEPLISNRLPRIDAQSIAFPAAVRGYGRSCV